MMLTRTDTFRTGQAVLITYPSGRTQAGTLGQLVDVSPAPRALLPYLRQSSAMTVKLHWLTGDQITKMTGAELAEFLDLHSRKVALEQVTERSLRITPAHVGVAITVTLPKTIS